MSCNTRRAIRKAQEAAGAAVLQPTTPPQPYYARAERSVRDPYEQAKAQAERLQRQAERILAAAGLPTHLAYVIRSYEPVGLKYARDVGDALGDLWNELADAGNEEAIHRSDLRRFFDANDPGDPVEPWQLTLDEYLGDQKVWDDLLPWSAEYHLSGVEYNELTFRVVRPGFAVARIVGDGKGVVLLKEEFGQWTPIGAYRGTDLGILPEYQGLGLSYYLIVEKGRANGGAPAGGGYSPAGLAAHRSAHRRAVREALFKGWVKPRCPLAAKHFRDYPELKPMFFPLHMCQEDEDVVSG